MILERFDRRWIFVAMALAIVVPLLHPLALPVVPSPEARAAFAVIDAVPEGATVLFAMDLEPAATAELEPFIHAAIKQLKRKRCKLAFLTLMYQAPPLVERWIREDVARPTFAGDRAYENGKDYVWLGFREGKQIVIANLGQDLAATFNHRDATGRPLGEIEALRGITRLADFPLILSVSSGAPGTKEYVQQVQARYGLHIVGVTTAVSLTDLTPYYQSGQLVGLLGGMVDTADYEILVARLLGDDPTRGLGARGLDVLNVGHIVVIAAIVLGNLIALAGRRRA
jgi:hypothetical protein